MVDGNKVIENHIHTTQSLSIFGRLRFSKQQFSRQFLFRFFFSPWFFYCTKSQGEKTDVETARLAKEWILWKKQREKLHICYQTTSKSCSDRVVTIKNFDWRNNTQAKKPAFEVYSILRIGERAKEEKNSESHTHFTFTFRLSTILLFI